MEEISSKITEWLIKQQVIQRDDMEIYQYGLFHMIMNLADIISIILISLYFGKIELAVIYLVFFCVLRKYAGGYHAKTIVGCYIITLSTVTLMFGVVNYWNTSLSSMIWVFVNAWNSMKPGKGKSKIDTVAIMMHGKYYALIIDGENNENVVANDVGLATSDEDATTISSLEEKNIQTLHLYSCNAGLLDAIDCSIKKKVDGTKKKFIINHNVAMAFYKLGKIDEITAYDGSVAFTADKPRLSNDQASAFEAIIELQPSSNVDVKRYEGKVRECFEYLRRPIQNGPYLDESGICPNGEVKYDSSLKRAIYKYYHKKVEKKGFIKKNKKIMTKAYIEL